MTRNRVVFRADGGTTIGIGHMLRVLALAAMVKDHFKCVLATAAPGPFVSGMVQQLGIELEVLPPISYPTPDERGSHDEIGFDLDKLLLGDEIVVTDGYWFGTRYQQAVKDRGCILVCIDDDAAIHFVADVIINHAPGVDPRQYQAPPETRLLLGLDYLLLRSAFYEPCAAATPTGKVFISMGGSDHMQLSAVIVRKIRAMAPEMEVAVLVSEHFTEAQHSQLQQMSNASNRVVLHQNLDATTLARLIDASSHCVVAASTVLLECYARCRKAFAGYYVANQQHIYSGMLSAGLIAGGGNLLEQDDTFNAALRIYLADGTAQLLPAVACGGIQERYLKLFNEIADPAFV